MTAFMSRHRAALGLVSLLALLIHAAVPESAGSLLRFALILVVFFGAAAVVGSPYWKVLYREAPLRRALTGVTDLDEREAALRDRANGLTYYLFVTVNLCLLFAVAVAADVGWRPDVERLLHVLLLPYAFFALGLPVVMIEWFEPSGDGPEAPDEEDE